MRLTQPPGQSHWARQQRHCESIHGARRHSRGNDTSIVIANRAVCGEAIPSCSSGDWFPVASLRTGCRWRSYEHRSRHREARRLGHGTATPATSQRGGGLAVVVSDFVESGDCHAPARGASARNDWIGCHSRLSCALHHGSTRNDAFKCVCPDSSLAFTRGKVVNDPSACSSHRKDPWGFPQPQGSGLRCD